MLAFLSLPCIDQTIPYLPNKSIDRYTSTTGLPGMSLYLKGKGRTLLSKKMHQNDGGELPGTRSNRDGLKNRRERGKISAVISLLSG
jgi:hypothetical protein